MDETNSGSGLFAEQPISGESLSRQNYHEIALAMLPPLHSTDAPTSEPARTTESPFVHAIHEYGEKVVTVQSRIAQQTMGLNREIDAQVKEFEDEKKQIVDNEERLKAYKVLSEYQELLDNEVNDLRMSRIREKLASFAVSAGKLVPISKIQESARRLEERIRKFHKLQEAQRVVSDKVMKDIRYLATLKVSRLFGETNHRNELNEKATESREVATAQKKEIRVLSEAEKAELKKSFEQIELGLEGELYDYHDHQESAMRKAIDGAVEGTELNDEITRLKSKEVLDDDLVEDAKKFTSEILADIHTIALHTAVRSEFAGRYKADLDTFLILQGLRKLDTTTTSDGRPLLPYEQQMRAVVTIRMLGEATKKGLVKPEIVDTYIEGIITHDQIRRSRNLSHDDGKEQGNVQRIFELIGIVSDPVVQDRLLQECVKKYLPKFTDPTKIDNADFYRLLSESSQIFPLNLRKRLIEMNSDHSTMVAWLSSSQSNQIGYDDVKVKIEEAENRRLVADATRIIQGFAKNHPELVTIDSSGQRHLQINFRSLPLVYTTEYSFLSYLDDPNLASESGYSIDCDPELKERVQYLTPFHKNFRMVKSDSRDWDALQPEEQGIQRVESDSDDYTLLSDHADNMSELLPEVILSALQKDPNKIQPLFHVLEELVSTIPLDRKILSGYDRDFQKLALALQSLDSAYSFLMQHFRHTDQQVFISQNLTISFDPETQRPSLKITKDAFNRIKDNVASLIALRGNGIHVPLTEFGLEPQEQFFCQELLEEGAKANLSHLLQCKVWKLEKNQDGTLSSEEFDRFKSIALILINKEYHWSNFLPIQDDLLRIQKEYPWEKLHERASKIDSVVTIKIGPKYKLDLLERCLKLPDEKANVFIQNFELVSNELFSLLPDDDKREMNFQTEMLLAIIEESPQEEIIEAIRLLKESNSKYGSLQSILEVLEPLMKIKRESRNDYISVIHEIRHSPVADIKVISNELIGQILSSSDPIGDLRKIEDVFKKNNLPYIGKIFSIFKILNSEEYINKAGVAIPGLAKASPHEYYKIILHDLLRANVLSASSSLEKYMGVLQSADRLMTQYESAPEQCTDEEIGELEYFCQKAHTLYDNSLLGQRRDDLPNDPNVSLADKIARIRSAFLLRPDQGFSDRIVEMYFGFMGLRSYREFTEYVTEMRSAVTERNTRYLETVAGHDREYVFTVKEGDIVKAVPVEAIPTIIDQGILAREYLGTNEQKDSTPFDTDFSPITRAESWEGTLSGGTSYGDILLVVRNESNTITSDLSRLGGRSGRLLYEKIVRDPSSHVCIRTGLGSSEISAIICKKDDIDPKMFTEMCMSIAQKGFYIPVTDAQGTVLFTPEMYQKYRKVYDGIPPIGRTEISFDPVSADHPLRAEIDEIVAIKEKEVAQQTSTTEIITEQVHETLLSFGIDLQHEFDTGLLGGRIIDIGSTGRHTNDPKSTADYDFSMRLNAQDIARASEIANSLVLKFRCRTHMLDTKGNNLQLRMFGVSGIEEDDIDIDIGITTFRHDIPVEPHDANSARLQSIRAQHGEQAYLEAIANIVIAKRVLKAEHAYKKHDDRSIGGMGVENWILQHNGNAVEAFQAFWDAAHDDQGNLLTVDEFRKRYRILDPGINIRFYRHDDFVHVMKDPAYPKILKAIEGYVRK